jgi:hypothetical protein
MTTPKPIWLWEDWRDDYLDKLIDEWETPEISTLGSALSSIAHLCKDILSEVWIFSSISSKCTRLCNKILWTKE